MLYLPGGRPPDPSVGLRPTGGVSAPRCAIFLPLLVGGPGSFLFAWRFRIGVWFVAFVAGGMEVFLIFGSLTLGALLYFWLTVPETKGRSLQELEEDLVGWAVG